MCEGGGTLMQVLLPASATAPVSVEEASTGHTSSIQLEQAPWPLAADRPSEEDD